MPPASECSTGNTLQRGGVGGDFRGFLGLGVHSFDASFLPIGPEATLVTFVSCPDLSVEKFSVPTCGHRERSRTLRQENVVPRKVLRSQSRADYRGVL